MSEKRSKQQRKIIKEVVEMGLMNVVFNSEREATEELCRLCGGGFISLMDRQTAEFYKKLK